MIIKTEEKVMENPGHCVVFSLETEKRNIPKDSLFPHGLVSRVVTFWALQYEIKARAPLWFFCNLL